MWLQHLPSGTLNPFLSISEGPRKGHSASSSTIAGWIRVLISSAYVLEEYIPLTWSSAHTFSNTHGVGRSMRMHWGHYQQSF